MSSVNTTRKFYGIAGSLSILAIPYFIMLQSNLSTIETDQSLCPFKMLTGFPCPGCGITKSIIFLYQGDLTKSVSYHLFGPFTILFCVVAIVILTAELLTKQEFFKKTIYSTKLAYFLGAALAIYHLTRIVSFLSTNNTEDILRQSIWK